MRKATQSASPVSLGTKRTCPKCATKFYDFNKDELACPKCENHFKVSELTGLPTKSEAREKKAAKKALPEEALMDSEDIVVGENSDNFESVEDIDDDEDEVVEDIKVDEDDEDF